MTSIFLAAAVVVDGGLGGGAGGSTGVGVGVATGSIVAKLDSSVAFISSSVGRIEPGNGAGVCLGIGTSRFPLNES